MKRVILFLILTAWQTGLVHAQLDEPRQFLVYFSEKPPCSAGQLDFHPKALERRVRHGIPFPQTIDCPLDPVLLDEVEAMVDSVRHSLRWLNAASVLANTDQVNRLKRLSGVEEVVALVEEPVFLSNATLPRRKPTQGKMDTLFKLQRKPLGFDRQPTRLNGKGVRIAVFDAGFSGADQHPGLQRLFENGQVKGARDFYQGKKNIYRHSGHGTAVLSCIAGQYKGENIGAAPEAEFLLGRTEHRITEKLNEEDAWLAAMEWADQQGADIISSSLGYGKKRYTYADMNGRKTLVSRAAAQAVRLGILVVNSAGNSGNSDFHYLTAPGDADSVLTVGATFPMLDFPMPFSSFGPNARGVTKPDVSAPGYVVAAHRKGGYDFFSGTSFACPLVAGLAACLIQDYPDSSNMAIHKMVRELGHLHPYFDYRMGHGVPNLGWLDERPPSSEEETFRVLNRNDTTFFFFNPNSTLQDSSNQNGIPFNFAFELEDGTLSSFQNLRLPPKVNAYALPDKQRSPGLLRAWFQGYLYEE